MSSRGARIVVVLASIAVFVVMGSAIAQEDTGEGTGDDRVVAEGRVVYEANCQACHQSDGAGLPGLFPPLLDNPAVMDSEYVVGVVTGGRDGELVVAGQTYNGVMPAFEFLSDDQVDSLVAYLQRGLGAPVEPPPTPTEPTSEGPGLPLGTVLAFTAGFGLFAVAAAAVGGPIALARRRRYTFTTVQVWLKVAAITVYFVVATVFIPSWVVQSDFLASPPSVYQDLFSADLWGVIRDVVGTGVWLGALLFGLWALRWAQRRDLI